MAPTSTARPANSTRNLDRQLLLEARDPACVPDLGSQVNINVSVVPDTGTSFGSQGPIQGDVRRGDIRIGARSLGSNALAVSTPFDLFGNWSGDVILNSDKDFI